MNGRQNPDQSKSSFQAASAAAFMRAAALFYLLFAAGCISQPPGVANPASAAPELPEAYETELRGINRTLIQAAFAGRSEEVRTLLSSKDSEALRKEFIDAALLLASVRGNSETVRVLLDGGADAGCATVRGGTPLMWAAGSVTRSRTTWSTLSRWRC